MATKNNATKNDNSKNRHVLKKHEKQGVIFVNCTTALKPPVFVQLQAYMETTSILSLYEWKILEWDDKPQTNKQTNKHIKV